MSGMTRIPGLSATRIPGLWISGNEGDDFSDPRMNRRRDRVAIGVTIGGDFQRSAVAWLLTRRSSCSESTECRLDFPFVRHTAAFSLVERLQLLG